jgi:FtsH-binding integral membrane protein
MYETEYQGYSAQERITGFIYRVYGWMAAALVVTAAVAYYTAQTPAIFKAILENSGIFFGLIIVQLALVIILSALALRLSYFTAVLLFMLYAVTVGLTLSIIFLAYEISSIYLTFGVCSAMFGVMAVYGYVTKADLTTVRSLGTMVLVGMIIGLIINMFLRSSMFDMILSGIGVILFTLLTAADTQKIKQIGYQLMADEQMLSKAVVVGALTLYLDFINLFLYLLRFLGKKRE